MRRGMIAAAAGVMMAACVSCVNVKAPENIEIGSRGSSSARVDSSRVPNPQTLEEARRDLHDAYARIQQLERQNADLERDKRKYKDERDDYKDKYKRLKDRYED